MPSLSKNLEYLFISKVRIKTIKYFLFNPDVPIHLRGAVRELKEEINAVRRELSRLEEVNFIKSETKGNRKYFSLDFNYIFLDELLGMFHKTFGMGGAIIKNKENLGVVNFAILTDSYIKGGKLNGHGVDLVVIGDIKIDVLSKIVQDAEKLLGREINYTVLNGSDFILRRKRRDPFVLDLLISEKVVLIGNINDLIS